MRESLDTACCEEFVEADSQRWSQPLTSYDLSAGIYAAGYDIEHNSGWLEPALELVQPRSQGQVGDHAELDSLRFAADQITGRFGEDSLYWGVAGYWLEMCHFWDDGQVYENQFARSDSYLSSLDWFAKSLHLPCTQVMSSDVPPLERAAHVNACVVVGSHDPIAAGQQVSEAIEVRAGHLVDLTRQSETASAFESFLQGLSPC